LRRPTSLEPDPIGAARALIISGRRRAVSFSRRNAPSR
jgi:hypothetical protein